ncbi:MAG: Gfo/Idh/MocA family oxidoreductase [Desulfocapsaceae bacterium]|jgi:predicted homoserine dehydrogenase-like protein|nr:Gfo/Idh/MocA family oxidoreductase [Desulfocapsaceae bacterium]
MNYFTELKKRAQENNPIKVGVVGAGKFSSMFLSQARLTPGMQIVGIADLDVQRAFAALDNTGWGKECATVVNSADTINDTAAGGSVAIIEDAMALISADCDVIMEITGNPEAGTRHALHAIEAGKHVVMVNVEADCLLGPVLSSKAAKHGVVYTMAYGDQPALIAEQLDWAQTVGFEVVCAGKGTRYQPRYHYSTPDTVWGYYGFSEERVAGGDYNAQMFNSFLDGSKSAIEMCAVANGSGLVPQKCGLQFPAVDIEDLAEILKPAADGGILEHSGTVEVIASEKRDGTPLPRDLRWGVYVVFKAPHPYVERCFQEYGMKTDKSGKYSALYRPYHYIGLELGVSVASAVLYNEPTGQSSSFVADVGAHAKKDLQPGDILDGEGGFTVFGKLMRAEESVKKNILPLGLTGQARVVKPVPKGSPLTYDSVELDSSGVAYRLRKELEAPLNVTDIP